MEDVFQILIVVALVLFAIVKQLLKTPTAAPKVAVETPERAETAELIIPKKQQRRHSPEVTAATSKSKTYHSISDSKDSIDAPKEVPMTEEEQEFGLQTDEEVKKAIIWSEILHRKY